MTNHFVETFYNEKKMMKSRLVHYARNFHGSMVLVAENVLGDAWMTVACGLILALRLETFYHV